MEDDESTDLRLGTTAELLLNQGEQQAAALLLDVESLEFIYQDILFNIHGGDDTLTKVAAVLRAPAWLLPRFQEKVTNTILDALREVALADSGYVSEVRVLPALVDKDWRESVSKTLGSGPTNQAGLAPLPAKYPTKDRLKFRDLAELRVYERLAACQASMEGDSFIIAPNAAVRVGTTTWEVDFLILHRGRCGVIEIDGVTHQGKRAHDRSRDRILEDSGISYVDHLDAADTEDPKQVDLFIQRFLKRLGSAN